jgi:hypothetical protein
MAVLTTALLTYEAWLPSMLKFWDVEQYVEQ